MKRKKSLLIIAPLFLLTISVIFFVVFTLIIPFYLERVFFPELAKKSGIDEFAVNVRKIGLGNADFASINVGQYPQKALSINSIRVDYSLSGLIKRQLKSIQVCGLTINFEVKEGNIIFSGIDPEKIFSENGVTAHNKEESRFMLPFTFDRIVIENALLAGQVNRQILRLPFNLSLFPENESFELLKCTLDLYPFESKVRTEILVDLSAGKVKVFAEADNFNPDNYRRYLDNVEDLKIYGAMNLKANAEMEIDTFKLSNTRFNLRANEFIISSNDFQIGRSKKYPEPLNIEIYGEDFQNWKMVASGLAFLSPQMLEIPEIQADIKFDEDFVIGHFELVTILNCLDNCAWEITPPFQCTWRGSAKYFNNAHWTMEMKNMAGKNLANKQAPSWYRIKSENADIGFFMPSVSVSGEGNLNEGSAETDVKVSQVYLDAGAVSVELPTALFKAAMSPISHNEKPLQALDFKARFINPGARLPSTDIGFKDISLVGRAELMADGNLFEATFRMEDGFISDILYGVRVEGIKLEIPLLWPFNGKAGKGVFTINSINLKEKNLGKIKAVLQQDALGGTIKGTYDSFLLSGLLLEFEGRGENTRKGLEIKINYNTNDYKIEEDLNLGGLFPEGEGVFLTGLFNLEGEFYQLGSKMNSSVNMRARNTNIFLKEPAMAFNNVHVDLKIPDLFQMRSLPHQQIRFDSATFGNISIDKGIIDFQVVSADHFFIEKTNFKWSGGNVDTNAAVVLLPFEKIGLTFYCDRLKLARVLQQLGGVKGDGEGAVNGRIPVRYENGKLRFDNGFLYSTPGESGTILLTGTDFLMAGIPEGTPHFAQIDLAREALKNYRYDWAKLDITSEGENLNLKLKLDGKPMDVLPFEYRKDFGGFARVEAGSPGSRFQGIRLDVNFNLPLDQVLRYGKGFQEIFKMSD